MDTFGTSKERWIREAHWFQGFNVFASQGVHIEVFHYTVSTIEELECTCVR